MWIGSQPLAANSIIIIIIIIIILIINILLLLLIVVMLEAQRWSVGAAGAAMVSQAVGIPAAGPSCYPCLAMLYMKYKYYKYKYRVICTRTTYQL